MIGDIRMIGLLKGLQCSFTKHHCFLCYWDIWARARHYVTKDWSVKNGHCHWQEERQVAFASWTDIGLDATPPHEAGDHKAICESPKLWDTAFKLLGVVVPKLLGFEIKVAVFDGPQIKMIMQDAEFSGELLVPEKRSWSLSFRDFGVISQ